MSRRKWLTLALLGIANCLVLTLLGTAVVFGNRIKGWLGDGAGPVAEATATLLPSATPPSTWTSTSTPSPQPTRTARPTRTPAPTRTPIPTFTAGPSPTPTPSGPLLENANFDDILPPSEVPGWQVEAVVNWQPGDDFNPESSYGPPEFKPADDARRVIRGTTLQIQTHQWVKFNVTLYQTATAPPGSRAQFQIYAGGFSSDEGGNRVGGIEVRAGIDPNGGLACRDGRWGETVAVDQRQEVATLIQSPRVVVGPAGEVTVCFSARPQYAVIHNAAFFDIAELEVEPPD
ncbi:MAG: hypothetical protein PVI59_16850 [Anaerolineae bacterium]